MFPQRVSSFRSLAIGLGAMIVVFIIDQLSKWIVLVELGPNGSRDVVTIVPGALRLIFVRNTGSAFGLFQGSSDALRLFAILAAIILGIYFARSASRDWALSLALGLQVGGALGNIVDRFRHGYVVDWIDVSRWPTFNIADSAITVGVALLVYTLIFRDPQRPDRGRNVANAPRATARAGDEG